ncbi:MAG: ATP synthase subunit I [Mariprofundaceae bacterium]|nr:ATP synthase subunit I [Mariprofundaceae bacterium]
MTEEFDEQQKPLLLVILAGGFLVSLLVTYFKGVNIGLGVLCGVCFMLLNQWLMFRQIRTMNTDDAEQGQKQLLFGAAKRFVALIVFLIIANSLGLHLLSVAAGLAVAYFILFAYSAAASLRN